MIAAELENAILERIYIIPMCPATVDLFDDNDNQVAVAQVNYIILDNSNTS